MRKFLLRNSVLVLLLCVAALSAKAEENQTEKIAGYLMECAAVMYLYGAEGSQEQYVTAATKMAAEETSKNREEIAGWLKESYKSFFDGWKVYHQKGMTESDEAKIREQISECEGLADILAKYNG